MKTNVNRYWADWLVPTGLIVLSIIPVVAGAFRLSELAGGADITSQNARFFASPLPVVSHIISVTLYSLLGAFQFSPGFRRRHPGWHRTAGRLLVPAGLVAALSGLWMSHFYPWPNGDGQLLYVVRIIFGSGMLLSILLGIMAVRRRDFTGHGAWMMRGYAVGMGAGTQAFTHLLWFVLFGVPDEWTRAMLMTAGWVINLAVAEGVIRRRPIQSTRSSHTVARQPL